MQTEELIEIVSDIRKIKSESQTIELKAAKKIVRQNYLILSHLFPIKTTAELSYSELTNQTIMKFVVFMTPRICKRELPNNVSKWIRLYEHYLQCAV